MVTLDQFCKAMDGEWTVQSRDVVDGKVLVHYVTKVDGNTIDWAHNPLPCCEIPAVGTVGRIGFVPTKRT